MSNSNKISNFKKTALIISLLIAFISIVVLAEWAFDLMIFRPILPHGITMNPMIAIFNIIFSFAIIIKNREVRRYYIYADILCIGIIILCIIKLFALIFHLNIYPDRILFPDKLYYKEIKQWSRIGGIMATMNIFFSLAIIFIDYELKNKIRTFQFLCFFNILIVLIQLYAWLYKINPLIYKVLVISVISAICIYSLALSILFSRPNKGAMRPLVGEYSTENIILRVAALLVPLIIGWLRLEGENHHLYSQEMGTAIFAITTSIIALSLIGLNTAFQKKIRKINGASIAKLKKSKERMEIVAASVTEGVIVANTSGEVLFFNKNISDILGKVKQHMPKEKWAKYYHFYYPDGMTYIDPQKMALFRALEGKSTDDFEVMIRNKKFPQGNIFSSNGRPIKEISGKVIEGIAIIRDITARKKLEKLYYANSKKLKTVLMSITEGVIATDAKGKAIIFNEKAKELTGIDPQYLTIENWSEYIGIYYPDKTTIFPSYKLPLFKALKGESTDQVELFIKSEKIKEGKRVLSTGRPIIDDDGNIKGGVVIFREVMET